jgi:hypothetical protein
LPDQKSSPLRASVNVETGAERELQQFGQWPLPNSPSTSKHFRWSSSASLSSGVFYQRCIAERRPVYQSECECLIGLKCVGHWTIIVPAAVTVSGASVQLKSL